MAILREPLLFFLRRSGNVTEAKCRRRLFVHDRPDLLTWGGFRRARHSLCSLVGGSNLTYLRSTETFAALEKDTYLRRGTYRWEIPVPPGEVTAKTLSLTSNLRTNGLEMTSEPPPVAGQAACKDRIAKRSLIQAATTLDVA
ncbi:hypothetical protein J6590_039897 [Homalodisca vitripennis]|nr:hypothetical protein J6590_039897 [Homalodisca vitripennis]